MGRETQGFGSLSPAQRKLAASIGALHNWAGRNSPDARRAGTAAARAARRRKFELLADPEGVLPPEELALAADRLQLAEYRRMGLASAKARAAKKAARSKSDGAPASPSAPSKSTSEESM